MPTPLTALATPPGAEPGWAWVQVSRLGEAQILLPALGLALLWLARRPGGGRLATAWLLAVGVTAAVTTVSKVGFIGFGLGIATLDFTGFSGHSMFAAAILPLLLRLAGGPLGPPARRALLGLGWTLAWAVAVSRVAVGAHSWSEVLTGFALGSAATAAALAAGAWPAGRLPRWTPVLLLAWGLLAVWGAPPSRTHDLVTRLSLALSGRAQPYLRWEMHRDHRRRLAARAAAGASLPAR